MVYIPFETQIIKMPRKPKLISELPRIASYFETQPSRAFLRKELTQILETHRDEWKLPADLTITRFLALLEEHTSLHRLEITLETPSKQPNGGLYVRYAWGTISPFAVALSLAKDSYISHGSAVFLHGLTNQLPHTIYVNREQSPKPPPAAPLTQEAIDRAFQSAPRTSSAILRFGDYRIVQLNGKSSGRLEVTQIQGESNEIIDVTKLERTLIDIAVRPIYAGGVFNVLEAYKAAAERVSVPVLVATLKKLQYVYPYHQVLGFYLQRAGIPLTRLALLRELGINFDFYADYKMPDTTFDTTWRLNIPQGT